MSNGRGKHKSRGKRRAHKTSNGIHGAKRHPLTEGEKCLLGKGIYQRFAPIGSVRHDIPANTQNLRRAA